MDPSENASVHKKKEVQALSASEIPRKDPLGRKGTKTDRKRRGNQEPIHQQQQQRKHTRDKEISDAGGRDRKSTPGSSRATRLPRRYFLCSSEAANLDGSLDLPLPRLPPQAAWGLPSELLPLPTPAAELHPAEPVACSEPPGSVIWAGREQRPTSPQAPVSSHPPPEAARGSF